METGARRVDVDFSARGAISLSSMDPLDVASLRREYETQGLRRADLSADPIEQFSHLVFRRGGGRFAGCERDRARYLHAPQGKPRARVVLLKGFDQRGFVFFTNYRSQKGRELEANPQAAFAIYWVQLERQIRVSGRVEKTSREESAAYFHSRPRASQLGAWVSHQSEVIDARRILEGRLAEMTERYEGREIELPPTLGRLPDCA